MAADCFLPVWVWLGELLGLVPTWNWNYFECREVLRSAGKWFPDLITVCKWSAQWLIFVSEGGKSLLKVFIWWFWKTFIIQNFFLLIIYLRSTAFPNSFYSFPLASADQHHPANLTALICFPNSIILCCYLSLNKYWHESKIAMCEIAIWYYRNFHHQIDFLNGTI